MKTEPFGFQTAKLLRLGQFGQFQQFSFSKHPLLPIPIASNKFDHIHISFLET
ncbi:hypothetical protein HanHA300_Chr13g0487591 [Helianthus annuus]|nr:hypothetical protein HanHA300_Chr13g0487591 [Helianthus annuus]